MKYIKKFETNNSLYKQYIVIDFSPYYSAELIEDPHYIFKVSPKTTENIFYYDAFYRINKFNKKLIKRLNDGYYNNYKNRIFNILYESNSLKEAVAFLYSIKDMNKYNL